MNETSLRLSAPVDTFPVSFLDGPGKRWVLWTQGCSVRCCNECINRHLQDPNGGVWVPVGRMLAELETVMRNNQDLEGVTISGGEPFDQAPALVRFAHGVREQGLTTLVYTGRVIEDLLQSGPEGASELIHEIDILLDGPFVAERLARDLPWVGSDNQRIILTSNRYSPEQIRSTLARIGVDVVRFGDEVHVSGATDKDLVQNILHRLRMAGYGEKGA